jgi:hypothetical protein
MYKLPSTLIISLMPYFVNVIKTFMIYKKALIAYYPIKAFYCLKFTSYGDGIYILFDVRNVYDFLKHTIFQYN